MKRALNRKNNELRKIDIQIGIQKDPAGSVMISYGNTKVLCSATIEEKSPPWMSSPTGWVTAEYAMLPGAGSNRISRVRKGRSEEIQRLIGRSLRAAMDLKILGNRTIIIDCDVIQADAGTRTASITGGFIALSLAVQKLIHEDKLELNPIIRSVASVSCAVVDNEILLDPDYSEDARAWVDMNFVMGSNGEFIEIQGTGEKGTFSEKQLLEMISVARQGCNEIFKLHETVSGLG
ncbi:MAG: ribonuclease PH [Deltaproteobacteria bacterium]|nr:ribonuclease PH [Deltaproteobacteria bacterium]